MKIFTSIYKSNKIKINFCSANFNNMNKKNILQIAKMHKILKILKT